MDRARPHMQFCGVWRNGPHTPACFDLLMITQSAQKVKAKFYKGAFAVPLSAPFHIFAPTCITYTNF